MVICILLQSSALFVSTYIFKLLHLYNLGDCLLFSTRQINIRYVVVQLITSYEGTLLVKANTVIFLPQVKKTFVFDCILSVISSKSFNVAYCVSGFSNTNECGIIAGRSFSALEETQIEVCVVLILLLRTDMSIELMRKFCVGVKSR